MTTISDPPESALDVLREAEIPSTNGSARADIEARAQTSAPELATAVSLPSDFRFDEVRADVTAAVTRTPPLGPLAAFRGDFTGHGFNTIFRPDNPHTPTRLPVPVAGSDNVLELNLTRETLSFSPSLGTVPNRGSVQGDVFLNGVPYLQSISDITTGQATGIHLEPGMWVIVPPTSDPAEGSTLVRMASIPHGTTINAQGKFTTFNGPPRIRSVDITPLIEGSPRSPVRFPSQTATAHGTPRIPQDLTPFIADGRITQAMLNDPNEVLRRHLGSVQVVETTAIAISTAPSRPLFGGGADNIAFLWGDAAAVHSGNPSGQNAQTLHMTATFWIEKVRHTLTVPRFRPGQHPLRLRPHTGVAGQPLPTFLVRPPVAIDVPRTITVEWTQIQYTQTVVLNFAGLSWPHVSVATLVPAAAITVPPSAFH